MEIWRYVIGGIGIVLVLVYLGRARGRGSRFRASWSRATEAYDEGDYGTAASAFDTIVRMEPTFAPGRRMRGRTRMQLGQLSEAEDDFRMAAALEPRNAEGYLDLGVFLATCPPFRDEEAIDAFESAIAFAPRFREDLAQAPQLHRLRQHPRFQQLTTSDESDPEADQVG